MRSCTFSKAKQIETNPSEESGPDSKNEAETIVWSEEEEEEEEEESSVFDTMNGLSDAQLLKTFRR